MVDHETPESLLKFFQVLDSGDPDESPCKVHYGCTCVLQKGRRAAEMLVAIRQIMGVIAPPEPQAQGDLPALAETTAQESATNPPLFEELASEKNKSEQLHKQNLKLVNENLGLRQRIQNLQRQVNRLCDTLEMRAIQKDIRAQGEKIPFAAESPLAAATPENDAAARPTGEDRLAGGTEPSPDESRAVPDAEVGL